MSNDRNMSNGVNISNDYDIAIIGAGPAGMSAALVAAESGATVVILDDKLRPGGQIYRNVTQSPLQNPEVLGVDYVKGQALVARFEQSSIDKFFGASVWHVGDNGEILFSHASETKRLTAREIIISCGAMERPFPIKGWHLPGVMSAGSAQVMLKNDGLVKDNAVFVGTGPLLYLIVAQYLRLGVKVKAVVDTTPVSAYKRALPLIFSVLPHLKMLLKGVGLLNEIRKSGTPVYRFASKVAIEGEGEATAVSFYANGQMHCMAAEHVFLHQGVIPNLNMTRSIGLKHYWCEQQLCWKPELDQWCESSVPSIAVAGDCGGIVGADAAEDMGRLAAIQRIYRLGLISQQERNERAKFSQRRLSSFNTFRRFIDRMYQPIKQHRVPVDDQVVVCRCEEQTVAQLKSGFVEGGSGPEELKGLTRCGMGPCQGRQCGHTVSELLADWRDERIEKVGYYRMRSPMRLLNLAELSLFTQVESKGTSGQESQHEN